MLSNIFVALITALATIGGAIVTNWFNERREKRQYLEKEKEYQRVKIETEKKLKNKREMDNQNAVREFNDNLVVLKRIQTLIKIDKYDSIVINRQLENISTKDCLSAFQNNGLIEEEKELLSEIYTMKGNREILMMLNNISDSKKKEGVFIDLLDELVTSYDKEKEKYSSI